MPRNQLNVPLFLCDDVDEDFLDAENGEVWEDACCEDPYTDEADDTPEEKEEA